MLLDNFGAPPPSGMPASDVIKDGSDQTFMADVIEASQAVPVIVDFWATWCGPCKQLGPLLEKVVREAAGRVKLVKVDIDKNPMIAQQLRIQSIPTVYAFSGGRPVDGFQGALPESQIRAFVQKLVGAPVQSPVEEAIEQAKAAMEAGDNATAGAIFGEILQHEPENEVAKAGLGQALLAEGRVDEARSLVESIPANKRTDPFVVAALSAVELAAELGDVGDTAEFESRLARDPADHEARFELANALFARGRNEEAGEHLIEIVRRDRGWNDEAARKQLVKFFEVWGPTHELTLAMRRRLSSILFS